MHAGGKVKIRFNLRCVHQDQPRGVPDFVGEVAADLKLFLGDKKVLAGIDDQAVAQGIRAVFVNDFQRIDGVAQRLGHLAALGIPHGTVDINIFKRNVPHKFKAGHNHPRYPEKDNLRRCE